MLLLLPSFHPAVLGLPLIMNLFGEEQGAVYSVMMACSSPLVNPLMVFEHTYFQGEDIKRTNTCEKKLCDQDTVGKKTKRDEVLRKKGNEEML